SSVLLEAVTAFGDVVRDQAILTLRENNVTVLTRDLSATQARFQAGEVTRTDVEQAKARRAGARSGQGEPQDQPGGVRARHRPPAEQPGRAAAELAGAENPGREHRDRP